MYKSIKGSIIYNDNIYTSKMINEEIIKIQASVYPYVSSELSPIAFCLPRSQHVITTMLALLELQIPYMPIDESFPQERVNYMMETVGIRTVITSKKYKNNFTGKQLIFIEEIEKKENCKEIQISKQNSVITAYVYFTSGSTGRPKAVPISRQALWNFFDGIQKKVSFNRYKTILSLSSVTFDIFHMDSVLPLFLGMTVVLTTDAQRKNPKQVKNLLKKYSINMLQVTPTTLNMLQQVDKKLNCLSNLSEIMIGGELISEKLLHTLQNTVKGKIYNLYGPTEAAIWSTADDITNAKTAYIKETLDYVQLHLLNENRKPVKPGEIGEIYITGKGLSTGYINNEEMTNKHFVFIKGNIRAYRTGDLGRIYGNSIQYVGRRDNQVKIRGHRIELEEIENVLILYKPVEQALAYCNHKEAGDTICALYIARDQLSEEELKQHLKKYIPQYMIPSTFIRVEDFQYTTSGKINRQETVKRFVQISKKKDMELEKRLPENIILYVLNNLIEGKVKLEDSLEDIELNSLLFITMVVELEEQLGIEFEDSMLSYEKYKTVNDIMEYVQKRMRENEKEKKEIY